jgi:hypothetical protein
MKLMNWTEPEHASAAQTCVASDLTVPGQAAAIRAAGRL